MMKYFAYIISCTLLFLIIFNAFTDKPKATTQNIAATFEWEKEVDIYVVDRAMLEASSCEATATLKRKILNAETFGPGALEALIKGLTLEEEKTYASSVDKEALIQKFEIIDRVAYVDFNSLGENIAGACLVTSIRAQIENTLTALPDIDSVVISVNNETNGILEP